MRDIGDEVAAHGFGLLLRRDVARQQQAPAIAIGIELHRQAHRPSGRAVAALQYQIVAEVLGVQIVAE